MSLRESSIEVVEQLLVVLDETGDIYCEDTIGSSIGKHVRHIVDHYDALIAETTSGLINYNLRSRESEAETDIAVAKARLSVILEWLSLVKDDDQSRPVLVDSEISIKTEQNIRIRSFFDRELAYVLSHTIHHIAHIKLLSKFYDVELASDLGVAPATLSYMR